jgi:hypothetical protein
MKQVLVLERSDLAILKSGRLLTLTVGGQSVSLSLEGRTPARRSRAEPAPKGGFVCPECEKICASSRARGVHRRFKHNVKSPRLQKGSR